MYYKKLVSLQKASTGSLYAKVFIYGNGDSGKTINDFSAEAIINCLSDEGVITLASGKIPDSSMFKTPEQIAEMPTEMVNNIDKVPMILPGPHYLCDEKGQPRTGANSRPIVLDKVDVTVIWDTNNVLQRDPVTHLPMLNPYNGGQFVYAPEVDEHGKEIRIYRKSWSPQERLDSMLKAGMLKPTGQQVSQTMPPAEQPQPNAATPDPAEEQRRAAMANLMNMQGGAQPTQPAQPGVTVPTAGATM